MNKIRVLLVDDEEDFRTPIASILRDHGLEIMEAGTAPEMDRILEHHKPDVIVLDVNLPGENGFEITSRLKQNDDYRIIMLTAYGEVDDRIEGITRGADYYLSKPVDTRELLAVVRNLSRRGDDISTVPASWVLNTTNWTLTTPDQQNHGLSKSELQLLTVLAKNQSKPVSRKALYSALGLQDYAPNSRSLDINISRLRNRFTNKEYSIPIKTIHSIGYLFNGEILIQT